MTDTLVELFKQSLILHSNKTAVIEKLDRSKCSLTYSELWTASCIVSETLSKIHNTNSSTDKGCQFVAICMEQCLIFPAVILGILSQGFGFAFLDPLWSVDKQNFYLKKIGASVIIHCDAKLKCVSSNQMSCIQVQHTALYFSRFQIDTDIRHCSHVMAYAVLTSGSTGQPKLVRVPHASIVPNIVDIVRICNITQDDVIFLSSPSSFDPSVVDMFMALTSGASLMITSKAVKATPSKLLHTLFPIDPHISERVTVLQITPSVFNRWSEREIREQMLTLKTSLRVLIFGGEPFPSLPKLKRCVGPGNRTQMFSIYGITEVSSWASVYQVLLPPKDTFNVEDLEKLSQLGNPLSETCLQVRDCITNSVIESGHGEMFIGSSKRICEIDDEKCSEYKAPVFRSTGDIVEIKSNGTIYYVGRKDFIVKRWGHRISLERIEHIALGHTGVKCALCVWDEQNHKLALFVSVWATLSTLALRRYFLSSIGSDIHLMPDEILQVQDIPLSFHGKVDRTGAVKKIVPKIERPLPEASIPEIYFNLCCEVLGLDSFLTPEASFISYGGTSLLAVILMSELKGLLGQVPENLVDLLLSGASFQTVCDKLCQFHSQSTNVNDAAHPASVKEPYFYQVNIDDTQKKQESCNEAAGSQFKQDRLLSFSLRGRSTCEERNPCLSCKLENISLVLSWKINLDKCIDASPLGLVYESGFIGIVIGSHSGKFVMVDGHTGQARWSVTLPDRIESSACVSACGQYVFVGCYDGGLYCVNSMKGTVEWAHQTGGMIKCCPVICNRGESVLFGSYDFRVYCICSKTGKLQWSNLLFDGEVRKGSWQASPLIVNELAVVCSLSGKVAAVQSSDGKVVWSLSLKSPVFSTPCQYSIDFSTYILVAEVQGTVHCLKALSGEQVWKWEAGGHIFAPLCVVSKFPNQGCDLFKILIGCYDSHLYCLNITQGNEVALSWKQHIGATIGSAPFPFATETTGGETGCVAAATSAGALFLMHINDGNLFCQHIVSSEVFSSPVILKDKLYFGCRDNNLYCLHLDSKE